MNLPRTVFGFIFFSFYCISSMSSQNYRTPDEVKIKREIQERTSDYYYSDLLELYIHHYENLSMEDYYYLYYGKTFQQGYSGHTSVLEYENTANLLKQKKPDYKQLQQKLESYLKLHPLATDALMYYAFTLEQNGDSEKSAEMYKKLRFFIQTILHSGDGRTEKTAWHVASLADEQLIIDFLGYKMKSRLTIESKYGTIDYIKLSKNKDEAEGVYFNISLF
jgi:hypothetical protein